MHSRYYTTSAALRAGQLASWDKYRELELQLKQNAVTEAGDLLEYETLELRIHPPNVRIDNESNEDKTVLIIDSANRPGTLVEVVQCLTELGLSVSQARVSSDGGWFVDEFHVSETPAGRVTDSKKLDAIKSVLSLPEQSGEPSEMHTVFQIAGPETPGILAEITQLLSHNGLEIRTAAAWTYNKRAAIVLGVTEHNAAVCDRVKLHRLKQLLVKLVEKKGDAAVSIEQVEGPVHHERRLHQLLLADEIQAWKQLTRLQRQHSLPFPGPINTSLPAGAADTDAESDQMPQTPQQQWQRRMLPPTWTVDPRGRLMLKDDPVQQQQQPPQQQQYNALQQQKQHHSQDALDDAAAAGAADAVVVNRDTGTSGSRLPNVETASMPPLPADAQSSTAVGARDGGVHARDQAAVAAAAAQQASVDKLIALLQPQPSAHATTKGTAAEAAGPAQIQQASNTAGKGIAAAPAGPVLQTFPTLCGSVSLDSTNSSRTVSRVILQDLASFSRASKPQDDGCSSNSSVTTNSQQQPRQPSPVLPPRGSGSTAAAGPSITSSTVVPTAQSPHPLLLGSVSAPVSPLNPRAADSTAEVAGPGAVDCTVATALLNPDHFASAAAAAGQISPRAFIRAGSTPVPGATGSTVGVQQHPLQPGQQLSETHFGIHDHGSSPEVNIQHSSLFNYWLVTIRCRDRNKLFFDTVCTLCDMRYDIYHATIDGEASGWANQLFYIRPRFGVCDFDERRASVLKAMLVSAVQRRFPQGLRVHVFTGSTVCLQDLFNSMRRHGLTITRCKVRAYENASHTFYLLNQDGSLPSKQYVRQACQASGGELVEAPLDVSNPCVATVLRSLDARGRFAFSFVNRRQLSRLAATSPEVAGAVPFGHTRVPAARGLSGWGAAGMYDDHGLHGGGTGKRGVAALALMRSLGGRDQHRGGMSAAGSTNSLSSDYQPSF